MMRGLAAISVLIALGLIQSLAVAQNAPQGSTQRDPITLLDRLKTLTEQLDLSADQKTQIESIFKKAADDVQSAKAELQDATSDEKIQRYRDLFADLRQQVGALLSDDQKAELQQKLQAMRGASTAPSGDGNASGNSSPTPAAPGQGRGLGGGFGGRFGGANGVGGNGPGNGAGGGRGGQIVRRLSDSLSQLGLSADQQEKVDDLLKDVQKQMQALRAAAQSGALDRQSVLQTIQSIFETTRKKLGDILTPDQMQKLGTLMPRLFGAGGGQGRGRGFGGAIGGAAGAGRAAAGNQTAGNSPPIAPPPTEIPPAVRSAEENATAAAPPAPAMGQQAPDFSLKALNGETVQLSNFNHKVLVLVLGSYTNPTFRDRAAGLENLREQYGSRGVNFLIVYTRETHPAGGWEVERNTTDHISIAQPTTPAQRQATAETAKAALNLTIQMAVDTMDNKTATAYAVGDGTPAYVIGRDGKILFHQSWLEPMALEDAIEDALK